MAMALRCCKLRSLIVQPHRFLCSSSKDKTRATLSLIHLEQDPHRILDICRSAALCPDSHLDRIAYSKAVSKLRQANHYQGIRTFIDHSINQLSCKSERALSHFIILYGHGGLVTDAIQLFDEMSDMGIHRTVKTLNSLLFSCVLARDYDEMKRVFSDFPIKYGLSPNLDTYNTVLKGLCHSGRANEAHSILAEMERKAIKPNATTFATVIAGFYSEQNFNDVGKMMALMKKYEMEPGISIYNVRIQSLCKLKRSSEAKALFDGIIARGIKANSATYGHLIYGFCREGKLEMAKRLYKEMMHKEMKAEAECYFTLVYYLCEGGDFEAALGVCQECMLKGWVPNITTMKCLVKGLVRMDKVKEAREIIGQVKQRFSRNGDGWREIEDGLPN